MLHWSSVNSVNFFFIGSEQNPRVVSTFFWRTTHKKTKHKKTSLTCTRNSLSSALGTVLQDWQQLATTWWLWDAMASVCIRGFQWEFQDPKMEVLYHIRPYFGGIFPDIGLTLALYIVGTSNLGSWKGHWTVALERMWAAKQYYLQNIGEWNWETQFVGGCCEFGLW